MQFVDSYAYVDIENETELYNMFNCTASDSDDVFEAAYDDALSRCEKDSREEQLVRKAYNVLLEQRQNYVRPGDVQGEERCLKNIENRILSIQEKLRNGYRKAECREDVKSILLNIHYLSSYWYNNTMRHFKQESLIKYTKSQYEDIILSYYEKEMQNRILGSKDEKVSGWLKNYSKDKGDFVHYARHSMAFIRNGLIKELIERETKTMDAYSQAGMKYADISDEEAKMYKKEEKRQEEKQKKYEKMTLLCKQAFQLAPRIISVSESMAHSEQAVEFYRFFMVNAALTWTKEILENQTGWAEYLNVNENDIFDALHFDLLDFIMEDECQNLDEIAEIDLKNYKDLAIQKEGKITFFKNGIKYIDDILVQFYNDMEEEPDKKKDSIKVIRTRHWNHLKKLLLLEGY